MVLPIPNAAEVEWFPCKKESIKVTPGGCLCLITSLALVTLSILWIAQVIPINKSHHQILFSPAIDGCIGLVVGLGLSAFFLTRIVSPRFRQLPL